MALALARTLLRIGGWENLEKIYLKTEATEVIIDLYMCIMSMYALDARPVARYHAQPSLALIGFVLNRTCRQYTDRRTSNVREPTRVSAHAKWVYFLTFQLRIEVRAIMAVPVVKSREKRKVINKSANPQKVIKKSENFYNSMRTRKPRNGRKGKAWQTRQRCRDSRIHKWAVDPTPYP